ncbi:hypothetical protein F5Y11DRAFT_38265 [Daldinia sp. FL1419]|nr:hypothetical protein F5Y11DRAFT_38265 [Daldinia sp. FL1419]
MAFRGPCPGLFIDAIITQCPTNLWGSFIIGTKLIESSPSSQSSVLILLPPELILMVFGELDPFSKVCLALTCKNLLQVGHMAKITIPSGPKHRHAYDYHCLAVHRLLHLALPIRRDGTLNSKNMAVCSYCYRYRPTEKSHWERLHKQFSAHCSSHTIGSYIASWESHSSPRCPECSLEVRRLELTNGSRPAGASSWHINSLITHPGLP